MKTEDLIPIERLCTCYEVEVSFFSQLHEVGLIETVMIDQVQYLHNDRIDDLERIVRIHHELEVNIEGIDVVLNLLKKVEQLQEKLNTTQERLRLYETDQ